LNKTFKTWFKRPYRNPHIAVSVDIMATGVDIPCVRYIAFAALTQSVGKYIQMLGRGTRLDPKTGKFSFKVLDFVGLCKRMDDNGKGSPKPNVKMVEGEGKGAAAGIGGDGTGNGWFIIDNPDPAKLIQRVWIHGETVQVKDNIPIDEARRIFEQEAQTTTERPIVVLKEKSAGSRITHQRMMKLTPYATGRKILRSIWMRPSCRPYMISPKEQCGISS